MSDTKHTPGKWLFDDEPQGYGRPGCIRANRKVIAEINALGLSPFQYEANAALIAAAPDMLGALKAVEPWMKGIAERNPAYTPTCKAHSNLLAAIAKAEGREGGK